ncbi:hypothetical protein [Devosia nitrariae]|uniref:Uncharacterized protein n=1 Tax=Devosia nitrariae TaxID=2071872 RepID=A0ABQ5WCJ1_9HYPH|nr:hypothetical protein [Devosia nitrariae]GLQ57316.1 hypothetical protein GCM10010862_45750 [Devosia nitrariae]
MAVVSATGPILAGAAASADYRPRTSPGHATILQDSTVPARQAALLADQRPRERQRRRAPASDSDLPAGAMFAASIAAAELPVMPESYEELARRLDSRRLPQEPVPLLPRRLV